MKARNYKHGLTKHPLYKRWTDMNARCYNSKRSDYKIYGARGIGVYCKWQKDFKMYYDYVMALPNALKLGYSIDRIDNDGNYEPGNVRWSTYHIQNTNQRMQYNNTSGFTGVTLVRNVNKWRADIVVNRKRYYLGCYETPNEANEARLAFILNHQLFEYV